MRLLQTYVGQGVECGSLNVIDPNKLRGSGNVGRYTLAEVGVALLKGLCH